MRGSGSKKQVVWDEENLQQNEEIQKQYSAVRIAEPKTPYRPPLPSDSLEDEMMRPLQLDEVADALQEAGPAAERMTAFEYVMSNGGASYDGGASSSQQQPKQQPQQPPAQQEPEQQQPEQPPSQQQQPPAAAAAAVSNASAEADGDEEMQDAVGDKRSQPCTSFTSSDAGSEGSVDKRRRFELMRRQHYNMKDALLKARQLLSQSEDEDGVEPGFDEEDEEYEEQEDDDTAGCQVGNDTAAAAGRSRGGSSSRKQQQQQPSSGAS